MMTSTYHNPVIRRQLVVARIVREEYVPRPGHERSPHRRPDEVGFEAEEKVEDVRVEFCVERVVVYVVFRGPPGGETRSFIVDEEAAVFDHGLTAVCLSGEGVNFVVFLGRGVKPEVEPASLSQQRDHRGYISTHGDCPACSASV